MREGLHQLGVAAAVLGRIAILLIGFQIAIGRLTSLVAAWIATPDNLSFVAYVLVGYFLIYQLFKQEEKEG